MTQRTLSLASPAKLNLFLHVTGQRADGYHELETVFQLIDLCDQLDFDSAHPDIQVSQLADVNPDQNIIYQAAMLLKQQTGHTGGCHIQLHKQIPMGAGLGGGSSNAATTLLALNQLWHTQLSIDELAQLGLQLGADVPVFIYGNNAWATGVGEQLSAVNLPHSDYIVLKPDCFISTKQLFLQEALTRNTTKTTFAAYQQNPMQYGNNFEAVATQLYPAVADALTYLNQFGQAHLTGTGACVFLAVTSQQDSKQILQNAPCKAFFCSSLNKSPVHSALGLV